MIPFVCSRRAVSFGIIGYQKVSSAAPVPVAGNAKCGKPVKIGKIW